MLRALVEKTWRQKLSDLADRFVGSRDSFGADFYTAMFAFDCLVFAITIVFFDNFSSNSDNDLEYVRAGKAEETKKKKK